VGNLIRATNLWGYPELVDELGGDPAPFLRRLGIRPGIEQDTEAFVEFAATVRLIETTAAELDCPDFGLRLSRWQGLDILGPVAVIARNAETVRDALTAVARYLYVHSPALRLQASPAAPGPDLTFTYEMSEPNLPDLRQSYELSLANAVRIVGLLAGDGSHLSSVSFAHEQIGPTSSYTETLGCPVLFGQDHYGFQVPAGLAGRAIDSADRTTLRIATQYLEAEFLPERASFTEQVAALSRRLLPVGRCTTETIAEQLAMHPRTLQRRLAEEGVQCQDVIDAERRRQAVRYLGEPRLQLGQVSRMLGFAEQSSLNRACLRWFGRTPGQARSELKRGGADPA